MQELILVLAPYGGFHVCRAVAFNNIVRCDFDGTEAADFFNTSVCCPFIGVDPAGRLREKTTVKVYTGCCNAVGIEQGGIVVVHGISDSCPERFWGQVPMLFIANESLVNILVDEAPGNEYSPFVVVPAGCPFFVDFRGKNLIDIA